MNRNLVIGVGIIIVAIAGYAIWKQNQASTVAPLGEAAQQTGTTTTAPVASVSLPSGVTLMQSTGVAFSSSPDYSRAYEIYPNPATGAKKALGAFGFSTKDLGGGVTKLTLTNSAEGYQGQSVIVGPGQSVYFVEKSTGDDSDTEDSSTRDDYMVAVDQSGAILK